MSETADKPLLSEQSEAPKKATKRRASTTTTAAKATKTTKAKNTVEEGTPAEVKPKTSRTRAVSAKTAASQADPVPAPASAPEEKTPAPAAKPRSRTTATRKKAPLAAASDELPFDTAPAAPVAATPAPAPVVPAAPKPAPAPAPVIPPAHVVAAKVVADGATAEEWSPSAGRAAREKRAAAKPERPSRRPKGRGPAPAREQEAAPAAPAPAAAAPAPSAPEAPATAAAPAQEAAPVVSSDSTPIAAPPPPGRKYPVYIPRHIAKQMEAEGQTDPAAIAAAAAAAAQAAAAAAETARREREPHPHARSVEPRPEPPPPREEELGMGEGIVEISGKGFGFIRDAKRSFAQHPADIFVTPELVKRYNLRDGQWIKGETRKGGRGSQLYRILEINGEDPEKARTLPAFDELTVINPMERYILETTPERYTTRVMDLMTPVGKGQRGLIVAPPRTGKTTLLQHIADAVVKNHPEVTLIMLLVDERPEEVTEIKRTVPTAELMASSNDMDVKSHTRIAQLAVERAKRLVESGKDVFILLDSITRVGRAFNNAMAGGGRTMSGGMDSRALEIPRKLFAAARNTEEAGSLTIIATALIETGSRMDDLIFQEFKGTGNMELALDRKIAEQRIYPAVDIFQSGTRREELLIPADALHKIGIIRRGLAGHKPIEAIERLLFFARKFPTNAQMLREIPG
ncbi:transcription termination factor Rho [Verrucomicrobiota bacterium sgz303538]